MVGFMGKKKRRLTAMPMLGWLNEDEDDDEKEREGKAVEGHRSPRRWRVGRSPPNVRSF